VVERMHLALDAAADIHTPYGATECLPVATIAGRELAGELSEGNRRGKGICVGHPLSANEVRVIRITDQSLARISDGVEVKPGEIGEICVAGPTVTDKYWQREAQTRLAKMYDEAGTVWHRMGDLGWIDEDGRLWYCGRKSERVVTSRGTLFTECVEGIANAVRGVYRSALVGVGESGRMTPILVVEPEPGQKITPLIARVARRMADHEETSEVQRIEIRKSLPVDIRHNAKIRRADLARSIRGASLRTSG